MEGFGGSFVKNLARLARSADGDNLKVIKTSWPGYWDEYEKIGEDMEQKRYDNHG